MNKGLLETAENWYPRFSEQEYERRFNAIRGLMDRENLQALVLHGGPGAQGAIPYLSNYIPRSPAWLVYPREGDPTLFLHFFNHIPCTKVISLFSDVRCYWPSAPKAVADRLKSLGMGRGRIGVIGLGNSIPYSQFVALQKQVPEVEFVDASKQFNEIRWIRSEEELGWFRRSAYLTDLTCELLERKIRPGISEYDLSAIVHEAFLPDGGSMGIHFIAATPMSAPERFIPWQFLTPRTLQAGDAVITEITISYWGYGAQIHRPFAVAAEPTPLYRQLFDVALECFERVRRVMKPGSTSEEVMEATSIIEERGFTVYDSLVHGEGGRNPELGTKTSAHTFEPFTFQENMVIVIQPNPVTKDFQAGLQLGSAVVVKPGGAVPLHNYPFKFPVCG